MFDFVLGELALEALAVMDDSEHLVSYGTRLEVKRATLVWWNDKL